MTIFSSKRIGLPTLGAATVMLVSSLAARTAVASTINYTGSVVQYTVSATGTYDILAYGASGGGLVTAGGKGAEIGGDFVLTAGEVLQIVVGGQGASAANFVGGGGGTFVVGPGNTPLIVAGGGGGGGINASGGAGQTGTAGGSGTGSSSGAGGTNGNGGVSGGTSQSNEGGGGGGGFTGSGSGNPNPSGTNAAGAGGQSFAAGSQGGAAAYGSNGGFGGGGGGGFSTGGGGGGYSGGGGGTEIDSNFNGILGGGGGGGSFDASTFSNADFVLLAGQNSGNGSVVITDLTPVAATPEPSGLALFGTGLLSVAGVLRKRFA